MHDLWRILLLPSVTRYNPAPESDSVITDMNPDSETSHRHLDLRRGPNHMFIDLSYTQHTP